MNKSPDTSPDRVASECSAESEAAKQKRSRVGPDDADGVVGVTDLTVPAESDLCNNERALIRTATTRFLLLDVYQSLYEQ